MFASTAQIKASNPTANIWLSANAGSGKTSVLTMRIIRLLAKGSYPHKIICITFTSAGANEMLERFVHICNSWIILSDDELNEQYHSISQEWLTGEEISNLRHRFSIVIDDPTSLKIQTIHSLSQYILKSFPLEAGIKPFFDIMDDYSKADILQEVSEEIANDLLKGNLPEKFEEVYKKLNVMLGINDTEKAISSLFNNKRLVRNILKKHYNTELYYEYLINKFNPDNVTETSYMENFYQDNKENIEEIITTLQSKKAGTRKKFAASDDKFLTSCQKFISHKDFKVFINDKVIFTKSGTIKADIITKSTAKEYPRLEIHANKLAESLMGYYELQENLEAAKYTYYLLELFLEMEKRIIRKKEQKFLLDYDDLIIKASDLLANSEFSEWIKYKLDGGIDHILVDESQDTNETQWALVESICENFLSGENENEKTIFAVGDDKQSIYSFQGAESLIFINMREKLSRKMNFLQERKLQNCTLNTSYRSAELILALVDEMTKDGNIRLAMSKDEINPISHISGRKNISGLIELAPLIKKSEKKKKEQTLWGLAQEYDDNSSEEDTNQLLAESITQKIKSLLESKVTLPSTGKIIQPKDILLLIRERSSLARISDTLHKNNIEFNLDDDIILKEKLIIKDIVALASFRQNPHDDLNLAAVLKSPLISLKEESLLYLCSNRGNQSLWNHLKTIDNSQLNNDIQILHDILKFTKVNNVENFFNSLLFELPIAEFYQQELDGKANLYFAELLKLTKDFCQNNNASIDDFIDYFYKNNQKTSIKSNHNENKIRIMTIHKAKGLESPVVILAQTTHKPKEENNIIITDNLILSKNPKNPPLYSAKSSYFSSISGLLTDKEFEESIRLLYVAITRAKDELYVFGHEAGRDKKYAENEYSWYKIIEKSMLNLANNNKLLLQINNAEDNIIKPLVLTSKEYLQKRGNISQNTDNTPTAYLHNDSKKTEKQDFNCYTSYVIFNHNKQATAKEISLKEVKIISPSKISDTAFDKDPNPPQLTTIYSSHSNDEGRIISKTTEGTIIHKLLEQIPKVTSRNDYGDYSLEQNNRLEELSQIIFRNFNLNDEILQKKFLHEAITTLNHPQYKELTHNMQNEYNEVKICGYTESGEFVNAVIDKLIISNDNQAHIIDYKTTLITSEQEKIAQEKKYQPQMQLYKKLLEEVFPDKKVKTHIIFTKLLLDSSLNS